MTRLLPAALLLLVLALLLRVELLFSVVWFVVLLYVLARLWSRRGIRQVEVCRTYVDRAFTGDEVPVDLVVRNGSWLPLPWLEVSESIPLELTGEPLPAQAFGLGPYGERRLHYSLKCRRRGCYTLGPLRLQTGDVFGLDERTHALQEERRMIVYPRVVPLQRLGLPTRSALVALPSRVPVFEDPSRVVGVREYQTGDSPRRIHWKASARLGQMMVKQYQPAVARTALICLDMGLAGYASRRREACEQAVVVAASLAHHIAVRERLPIGLATEGHDPLRNGCSTHLLPPAEGSGHLMNVLETLARVQLGPAPAFSDLLRRVSVSLPWGATLIAVTGTLDDDLVEALFQLKRSGYALGVVLVGPRDRSSGDYTAHLAGVPLHRVWTDEDLAVGL